MKSDSNIIAELHDLETDHAELESFTGLYLEVCKNLATASQKHQSAVERLNDTALGKISNDLIPSVKAVASTHRANGLLMLEASRHLARMGAKCLALADKMDTLTEGDAC